MWGARPSHILRRSGAVGLYTAFLALLTLFAAVAPLRAQSLPGLEEDGKPALLQADEVIYDQKERRIEARGNVEIARGERVLLAESVSYNLDEDVIRAEGDITLLEPSGEVVFAESIRLKGDLREGTVRSFRMLLTDRSRLAAANAVRVKDNRTILRKVVFSPCDSCESDPERPPLWQIKAGKVVHDQDAKLLIYEDASLEFFGVPIAYTPYFEHPDPTVARKTGFLTPDFTISEELGAKVRAPFYYAMSPQRDITVTPIVTAEQGLALQSEYRAHTDSGRYRLAGSGTIADRETGSGTERDTLRGHLDAEGEFNINRTFRWGFTANRATDDTYKRIYDFGDERFLNSEAYVEGFDGPNYLTARSFVFQSQRQNDPDGELPYVLPEAQYHGRSAREIAGGHGFIDAGLLGITRSAGRDSRRLSGTVGWERRVRDDLGGALDVTLALHNDLYSTDGLDPGNVAVDPANPEGEKITGRIFPQLAASYSLPVARRSFLGREVLSPRVQVVAGPNGANDDAIPNEDSRDFSFEDTNLFRLNRFPGRDRVSTGQRIDYGVNYSVYTSGASYVATFLGQSYRIAAGDDIPDIAGGDGGLSDIVGRVEVRPVPGIDGLYRFRLDEDTLNAGRNELALRAGPDKLRFDVEYTFLEDQGATGGFANDREEIFGRVSSRFARNWSAFFSHRRDIANKDPLESKLGLSYHDECFLLAIQAKETFFDDREVDPERSVQVRFALKHLGVFTGQ